MNDEKSSHVAVKPAQFSETNADGWFFILEAQFQLANINVSSTMFFHCVSALPASLVSRLSREILTSKDYEQLKAAVLAQVESSKPELFESLLSNETLAGRPSQQLSILQKAAGKVNVGEGFVRHKFLSSVDEKIRPVLAAQSTLTLNQLGTLADELAAFSISKNASCSSTKAEVGRPGRFQQYSSDCQQIRPFHPQQRPKICRAHIFYGPEAHTCRHWCTWPDKRSCKVVNSRPNSRHNSPANPRTKLQSQSNDQDTL